MDTAVPLIVDYIDQHKQEFGVGPICQALKDADLKIAPSTYHAARKRRRRRGLSTTSS